MIIPKLDYGKRMNDFMAVLKFKSFKDLTQFFYERPKFLEQLIKFNSYPEKSPFGDQDECWLFISNNEFQLFDRHLGIIQGDVRSGRSIRNKISGNTGVVYDNDPSSEEPMTHIKVKTNSGYATWLIKNVEAIK